MHIWAACEETVVLLLLLVSDWLTRMLALGSLL